MTNMRTFTSLIFLLFAAGSLSALTIDGIVMDAMKNQVVPFVRVHLLDSTMVEKCGTDTDAKDRFKFVNVMKGSYSIRISGLGFGDTTFASIKLATDTTLQFNIHKYCKYDASRNDKTCPVCHKTDKVLPVKYGLPATTQKEKKKKKGGEDGEFYPAENAATGCDPNWYCKRDKSRF